MMAKELLFDKALEAVMNGARFVVDFASRSLKIDGEYWVKNGETEYGLCIIDTRPETFLLNLEENYKMYKHSIPSERSEGKRRRYFKALPLHQLSDKDMMYGWRRDVAQAHLELFVLCKLLCGMKWQEEWGKWFWQSKNDSDLVLLRQWFEQKVEGV